ncbi:MAG: endonuclease/exonuclease/phosphatase family protein [Lachnospiraceae bacterium]
MVKKIKLLTLNIGNPSYERVQKQIQWIENREEDVFILTETKNSVGCNYMEQYFLGKMDTNSKKQKYYVSFPKSITRDLGVMIISKWPLANANFLFDQNVEYYGRAIDIEVEHPIRKLRVVGLYVPSRDRSEKKILRKKHFIEEVVDYLSENSSVIDVVCGDFNILERNHIPHYSTFFSWEYDFYDKLFKLGYCDVYRKINPRKNEYSWVGRTNKGYRYDHMFVSNKIILRNVNCSYLHETRVDENKFTDHSGMKLDVSFNEEGAYNEKN